MRRSRLRQRRDDAARLLFAGHRERLFALPRVSVNGNHQSVRKLEILLSGLALALWNRGRVAAL